MMRDFWYYGLRLRTDLPLIAMPPWPDAPGEADIVLRLDKSPGRPSPDGAARAGLSINDAGGLVARLPDLMRLTLETDSEGRIEIAPGASMIDVEGYLLSYFAGIILHRRGLLPLHASSVIRDGRAILFSGHSGRGKSTLATALSLRGGRLLSDDITVIRFDAEGRPLAVPGSPHLRLKADSIAANALDAKTFGEGRTSDDKKIWYRQAEDFAPAPVAALIRLDLAAPGCGPELTRLRGANSVLPLPELLYRFAMGRRLGRGPDLAMGALRLAGGAPIYRLSRPVDLDRLEETLALIVETV